MLIKNRYNYPKLKRIQTANGRQYTDGTTAPVPSVTTVLDKTADKTALFEWRKRVGDKEANRVSKESAGWGTLVHNSLEKYALGEDYEVNGTNLIQVMAKRATAKMIEKGLVNVDELWGVEVALIAEGLYAGTSDSIGVYKGVPSIIDFKTSKRIKKREWITDYFIQGIFYAEAHNMMYGTNLQQVVILMVDRENEFAEFIITGDEYEEYKVLAMSRLAQFYGVQV